MHPFKGKSQEKVGKDRAASFTKQYKRGGAVKGKTNITINLHGEGRPPLPALPPMVPPGGPPLPVGGPPIPPPGVGPGGPLPPMPRARGGKVSPMTAGADTGEGRLQKKRWYGKK